MWEVQMNYKKETESVMCPLCERKEDTTEHVIECGRENEKMYDLKDEHTKKEWLDVTKIGAQKFTGKIKEKEKQNQKDQKKMKKKKPRQQQQNNKRKMKRDNNNKRREKSRR